MKGMDPGSVPFFFALHLQSVVPVCSKCRNFQAY